MSASIRIAAYVLVCGLGLAATGHTEPAALPQAMPDLSLQPPSPPDHIRPRTIPPALPATQATLGPDEYLSVDVLLVIYTHYTLDTVSAAEVTKLLEEVQEGREFFARNSEFRFNVNIADTVIIDRELTLDQFWNVVPPNGYWYAFWEEDGVHSVRNDLYNLGYADNQFAAVFVYYAWANVDTATAAYGGGAYGVDVGFMGRTAYASVPLCWDPATNDWLFVHEFHHQLDDMFRASGLEQYPHADQPANYAGGYDDGYTFNGWMLQWWPRDDWANMAANWGQVERFTDLDTDTLPDSDPALALDEARFGSSTASADSDSDGLSDLHELSAHHLKSSDPHKTDTDADGQIDGADPYPIDPHSNSIPRRSHIIDGAIDTGSAYEFGAYSHTDPSDLRAAYYVSHTDSGLYCAFRVHDNSILTWWDDPFWNDAVWLKLDAQSNGHWAQGDDNYYVGVSPKGSFSAPLTKFWVQRDDGTQDETFIPASDIDAAYKVYPGYYEVELFLHTSALTGFGVSASDSIRFQLGVVDFDEYPIWKRYDMFQQFIAAGFIPCAGVGGDANCDDVVTSADIIYLVAHVFKSGPRPSFAGGSDVNCDGLITSADVIYLVNFVFKAGPAPCQ